MYGLLFGLVPLEDGQTFYVWFDAEGENESPSPTVTLGHEGVQAISDSFCFIAQANKADRAYYTDFAIKYFVHELFQLTHIPFRLVSEAMLDANCEEIMIIDGDTDMWECCNTHRDRLRAIRYKVVAS